MERLVKELIRGQEAMEGAGVRIRRYIGAGELPELDPILLLDEFRTEEASDYVAGFPDHPHRGFETVTVMVHGRMRHHDNKGNSGLLQPGGIQWMTAGAGLIHSEMPEQENGLLWGYQIWLNLAADEKGLAAAYWDVPAEGLPHVALGEGADAVMIAGEWNGVRGPAPARRTEPLLADVRLDAGAQVTLPVPATHAAALMVYRGAVEVGGHSLGRSQLALLGEGDAVTVRGGEEPSAVLLLAGKPLQEPVARYGPFVMNTREEIQQAFADFRAGRM